MERCIESSRGSRRRLGVVIVLAAALAACEDTSPVTPQPHLPSFVLNAVVAVERASTQPSPEASGATAAATAAPTGGPDPTSSTELQPTAPPSAGVGGGSGGGGSGGSGGSGGGAGAASATLVLPGGGTVTVPLGDAVSITTDAGEVVLNSPGRVVSTIDTPGGTIVLHPRVAEASAAPTGLATISGRVVGGGAGLVVQFLAPDRSDFQGGSTAGDGSFNVSVAVNGPTQGLLLVREATNPPKLALARVTADPATPATVPDLTLQTPQADVAASAPYQLLGFGVGVEAFPHPPDPDLAYEAASVQVVEGTGDSAWMATLVASSSLIVPIYTLPGFTQAILLRAANANHTAVTSVLGPVNHWDTPLAPPGLGSTTTPVAGSVLSWGAVPNAQLYVARLYQPDVPDPPFWEGLTTQAHLTLPASLGVLQPRSRLLVDAWNAPNASVRSIASLSGLRQLRVPNQPVGTSGRHSWAERVF